MRANEFVKKFGWDEAKNILNARRTWIDKKSGGELTDNSFVMQTRTYEYAIGTLYKGNFTDYDENSYRCGEVNLLMLENLVKSYNLVERVISRHNKSFKECQIDIHGLKSLVKKNPKIYPKRLKQDIADVESCL